MLATHAHAKTHRQVREQEVAIRVEAGAMQQCGGT